MTDWYHCIELPDGTVTPGAFDLRPSAKLVPLPADLSGKRCLDVGTWDGFWAFEMERRGAAEVVAIDIEDPERWDWPPRERLSARRGGLAVLSDRKPPGAGFAEAAAQLGSRARRVDRSVYELDPEADGRFDVVFVGSLLLHLRDPVAALDRIRRVCAGQAVIADTVEAIASLVRPRTRARRSASGGTGGHGWRRAVLPTWRARTRVRRDQRGNNARAGPRAATERPPRGHADP